jgi:hypothetical protein
VKFGAGEEILDMSQRPVCDLEVLGILAVGRVGIEVAAGS